jgi:hypothetical protein
MSLSLATRRQRENILKGVLETAGDQPVSLITKASIIAGKDRRTGQRGTQIYARPSYWSRFAVQPGCVAARDLKTPPGRAAPEQIADLFADEDKGVEFARTLDKLGMRSFAAIGPGGESNAEVTWEWQNQNRRRHVDSVAIFSQLRRKPPLSDQIVASKIPTKTETKAAVQILRPTQPRKNRSIALSWYFRCAGVRVSSSARRDESARFFQGGSFLRRSAIRGHAQRR